MELDERVEDHEKRIKVLEAALITNTMSPQSFGPTKNFTFSNKNKPHGALLEELLKSNYGHSKNGLNFEEILDVFAANSRPVDPKKIRDLLNIWKSRKKIEATKAEGVLRYFWIENE